MPPKPITHEEATEVLDGFIQSGKTVNFTLVFGRYAAIVHIRGNLGTDSSGQYFVSNGNVSCALNPDRYAEALLLEDAEKFAVGFTSPADEPALPMTVILLVVDGEGLEASPAINLTDWVN